MAKNPFVEAADAISRGEEIVVPPAAAAPPGETGPQLTRAQRIQNAKYLEQKREKERKQLLAAGGGVSGAAAVTPEAPPDAPPEEAAEEPPEAWDSPGRTAAAFEKAEAQAKGAKEKREQMRLAVLAAEEAASVAGMQPVSAAGSELAAEHERQRRMAEELGLPVSEADPMATLARINSLESQVNRIRRQAASMGQTPTPKEQEDIRKAERELEEITGSALPFRRAAFKESLIESKSGDAYKRLQVSKQRAALSAPRVHQAAALPKVLKSEATLEVATGTVLARLDAIRQLREEVEAARIEAESFPRKVTLDPETPFGGHPGLWREDRGLAPTAADLEWERRDKQLRALDTLEDKLNKIAQTSLGRPGLGSGAASVSASERDLTKIRETVKNMTGSAISE